MLKIGDQGISAAFLGSEKIKKAYLGESLVFDTVELNESMLTSTLKRVQYVKNYKATGVSLYKNKQGVYLSNFSIQSLAQYRNELTLEIDTANLSGYENQLFGNDYQYSYANASGNPTNRYYSSKLYLIKSSGKVTLYLRLKGSTGGTLYTGSAVVTGMSTLNIVLDVPKKVFTVNGVAATVASWPQSTVKMTESTLFAPSILAVSEYWTGRTSSSVSVRTEKNYTNSPADPSIRFVGLSQFDASGNLIHKLAPAKNILTGYGAVYDLVQKVTLTAYGGEQFLEAGPEV